MESAQQRKAREKLNSLKIGDNELGDVASKLTAKQLQDLLHFLQQQYLPDTTKSTEAELKERLKTVKAKEVNNKHEEKELTDVIKDLTLNLNSQQKTAIDTKFREMHSALQTYYGTRFGRKIKKSEKVRSKIKSNPKPNIRSKSKAHDVPG